MTLGRLNHVGVATPSIEVAAERWRMMLGADAVGAPFDLPEQGVRVCFVNAPNTQVELIEPLSDASPIARFLQRQPEGGQHHLCFEVGDLGAAVAGLGMTPLAPPRLGAHGTPVVFLHPRDIGGVLVELMVAPAR